MAIFSRRAAALALLAIIVPVLAACGGAAAPQVVRETVVVVQTSEPVSQTVVVEATADPNAPTAEAPAAAEAFTTPHPILSDAKVRQAIAYCTNRPELIASVYPWLSEEQQQGLLMDTFLPQGHWALNTNVQTYPFDVEKGGALLDEAGWKLEEGASVRTNEAGDPLSLSFTTTNAQFRQTWSAVFIQQMAACGIQIIPTYAPGSWWFGSSTGLARRDFELGAFAWVGQADPAGGTLYSCNQIPGPENNWEGQNYMGWCNEAASAAVNQAINTLDRDERIRLYGVVQEEFAKDMVSLPVFNRSEAEAVSNRLKGYTADPTEYPTADVTDWTLTDGDTVVIGLTQEPASLWGTIESSAVQRTVQLLFAPLGYTQKSYDFQPNIQTELATLENGAAKNEDVTVEAGATVWSTGGEAVELAPGVEYVDAKGAVQTYESGSATLKQLTVTYTFDEGITWEDGEPVKAADYELAYKIDCDPESGAVSLTTCESIADVSFDSDNSYTVTYHPGVQWATYFTAPFTPYPAHEVVADGRKLADVPAAEWQSLTEVMEDPLSYGPYMVESWEKGQSITLVRNPNWYGKQPAVETIVVKIIADTQQAVAQLLTGEVDVLGSETLGAGAEVQTVLEAAAKGDVQAFTIASSTWEHIDMNLNIK